MHFRSALTIAMVAMLLLVAGAGNAFAKYPSFNAWPKSVLSSGGSESWESYPSSETIDSVHNTADISWNNQWHNLYSRSVQVSADWVTSPSGGVPAGGKYSGPSVSTNQYYAYCIDGTNGISDTGTIGTTYQLYNYHYYFLQNYISTGAAVTDMYFHVV